jgi:hypothetical protein
MIKFVYRGSTYQRGIHAVITYINDQDKKNL